MNFPPVFDLLTASSEVTEIVGDRVYPHGAAPQAVDKPYVVWMVVSCAPNGGLCGVSPLDRVTVQIDCWHPKSAGVRGLLNAARRAVEGAGYVTMIELDQWEPETKLFRLALEVDIFCKR